MSTLRPMNRGLLCLGLALVASLCTAPVTSAAVRGSRDRLLTQLARAHLVPAPKSPLYAYFRHHTLARLHSATRTPPRPIVVARRTSSAATGTFSFSVRTLTDWSGAVNIEQGTSAYTEAVGFYQEPTVTNVGAPGTSPAWLSWWVGLGGCQPCGGTSALNKIGTSPTGFPGNLDFLGNQITAHQAWLQTVNGGSCDVAVGLPVHVSPGDYVGASIRYNGNGTYAYAILDFNTGVAYINPTVGSCGVDGTTADFIAERPSVNGATTALGQWSNPGLWSYTANNLGVSTAHQQLVWFNMVANDQTTPLDYVAGNAFTAADGGFDLYWLAYGP